MIVVEKELSKPNEMIDMVTTPDGNLVAMVHCNNCTSELNAWVKMIRECQELLGPVEDKHAIYGILFKQALEGDPDCGGLVAFNYVSGEPVTGFAEGRPLFVRGASDNFTLANFMRAQIYGAIAVLKIGNDVLFEQEHVKVDRITGHGGGRRPALPCRRPELPHLRDGDGRRRRRLGYRHPRFLPREQRQRHGPP